LIFANIRKIRLTIQFILEEAVSCLVLERKGTKSAPPVPNDFFFGLSYYVSDSHFYMFAAEGNHWTKD